MVNWWFGLVVWIPRIPFRKGLLLRGIPRIPNHLTQKQWCAGKNVATRELLEVCKPLHPRKINPWNLTIILVWKGKFIWSIHLHVWDKMYQHVNFPGWPKRVLPFPMFPSNLDNPPVTNWRAKKKHLESQSSLIHRHRIKKQKRRLPECGKQPTRNITSKLSILIREFFWVVMCDPNFHSWPSWSTPNRLLMCLSLVGKMAMLAAHFSSRFAEMCFSWWIQLIHPKDHWNFKTGFFEDPIPAIQVQTLPLAGPRSFGHDGRNYHQLTILWVPFLPVCQHNKRVYRSTCFSPWN